MNSTFSIFRRGILIASSLSEGCFVGSARVVLLAGSEGLK
jgi:hypothetical protein